MWRCAAAAGRPAASIRRPRRARRPRSTNGGPSTPPWSWPARPAGAAAPFAWSCAGWAPRPPPRGRPPAPSRRRGTLGLELRWLATQADRLADPATLKAVSRAVDHARHLVHDLQRDLEREESEREDSGER